MAEPHLEIATARYEASDIGESFVWGAIVLMLVMLVASAVLVVWLYPRSLGDRVLTVPLVETQKPRLQADPAADMRAFQASEMQQLETAGWADRAHGAVHIPIERAMQLIATEGLPDWPASSTGSGGGGGTGGAGAAGPGGDDGTSGQGGANGARDVSAPGDTRAPGDAP